jgi:hypothetical protein
MIILIILLIFIFVYFKLWLNIDYIAKKFKNGNVIVWGKKRKGKDLLFQKVINHRKKPYYTNYPDDYNYGSSGKQILINDLSVSPNTYYHTITNQIKKIDLNNDMEKKDIYIADAGIYLPSHQHHIISKEFPSLPIFYSIIGHLYDSNIHVNYNGSITRLYDKLREQADDYFQVLGNIKFFRLFFIKVRYYENYETAKQGLLPMRNAIFNFDQRALYEQYTATHGTIKDMWVVIRKGKIKYDTRYFKRLFGNDNE